jgi:hypothetical protein
MSTMARTSMTSSELRDGNAEPVYLLTRRRSSVPPPPAPSPSTPPDDSVVRVARRREPDGSIVAWSHLESERISEPGELRSRQSVPEGRISAVSDAWYDDGRPVDDDAPDISVRRATFRSRAIRVLGSLAVIGTLGGGAFVLQQPKVRREALSFVTMGHEEAAARIGRQVASLVERWRGR